jgi:hypothetical protein
MNLFINIGGTRYNLFRYSRYDKDFGPTYCDKSDKYKKTGEGWYIRLGTPESWSAAKIFCDSEGRVITNDLYNSKSKKS